MKFTCLISISLILLITITITSINSNSSKKSSWTPNAPLHNNRRPNINNFIKPINVQNLNKGELCKKSLKFSMCKKPNHCFQGVCVGDLNFGEKCNWLAKGNMCREPYQCHNKKCTGNFNVGQNCPYIKGVNLCRAPFTCEDIWNKPGICKIQKNWGCTKTSQCFTGMECAGSLYTSKFDNKKTSDLIGYYKTCNSIGVKIFKESKDYYNSILNWKKDPRRNDREFFVKFIGKMKSKKGSNVSKTMLKKWGTIS